MIHSTRDLRAMPNLRRARVPCRRNPWRVAWVAVGLGCLLSGCTLMPGDGARETTWQSQQQNVRLTEWVLRAKIGVKSSGKGGTATLKWRYTSTRQKIELYGPFGSDRIHIEVDGDVVTLRDTKGKVLTGDSVQEVLAARLGWVVPFDEMVLWARGLADDAAHAHQIDAAGYLRGMQQGPWQIAYQHYQTVGAFTLPKRMTITALPGRVQLYDDDGRYLGERLKITVLLKHWSELVARE